MTAGILNDVDLRTLVSEGAITAAPPIGPDQIQPASLDLRLADHAYRVRASFLPGEGRSVADRLASESLVMHRIDLRGGAVLETGCVYIVPLMEGLALAPDHAAYANPKSSTGRLDVFTRVIADGASRFDHAPAGYAGPLHLEIAPRTFSIIVRPNARLAQVRVRKGAPTQGREQLVSVDLSGGETGIVGYRARRHSGVVDVDRISALNPADFWEPMRAPGGALVLDPGEFYILASREPVRIAPTEAAEMAPIAPEMGEFRVHYAGFFDPGFGCVEAGGEGARAVLEVRGRDVPFILEHGQPVARLVHEPMTGAPSRLYGLAGSHYQAQGLKLSKHFLGWSE